MSLRCYVSGTSERYECGTRSIHYFFLFWLEAGVKFVKMVGFTVNFTLIFDYSDRWSYFT